MPGVVTGSFKSTQGAQKCNAERVLRIRRALHSLARAYIADWRWRRSLSLSLDGLASSLQVPADR